MPYSKAKKYMYMHNYLKNNYCPYLEILLKKSILWEKRERIKGGKKGRGIRM
jgi:hypothetical protein